MKFCFFPFSRQFYMTHFNSAYLPGIANAAAAAYPMFCVLYIVHGQCQYFRSFPYTRMRVRVPFIYNIYTTHTKLYCPIYMCSVYMCYSIVYSFFSGYSHTQSIWTKRAYQSINLHTHSLVYKMRVLMAFIENIFRHFCHSTGGGYLHRSNT